MKTNLDLYFLAPLAVGGIPGFLIYFLSNGNLFAEASLLTGLIAAAIRHRAHKAARQNCTTPFTQPTELERGYIGHEVRVNTYFMRGNYVSACIIVLVYLLSLVDIIPALNSSGCSIFLGLFSWIITDNVLRLKGVPVQEQGCPFPIEFERPKVINMPLYEATGVIVYMDV